MDGTGRIVSAGRMGVKETIRWNFKRFSLNLKTQLYIGLTVLDGEV
jgi:hypothetical protein